MSNDPKTLTIDELTELTGFDRRTIAYYVQEGLLPKVGRRGRLTRYPRFIADRLLFIKRLREAEEAGELPAPMTLAEIRDVFERGDQDLIADFAAGRLPFDGLAEDPPPLDEHLEGLSPSASIGRAMRFRSDASEVASREFRRSLMLEETDEPDLFVPAGSPDPMAVEEPIVDYSQGPPAYGIQRTSLPSVPEDSRMRQCASGPPPDPEEDLSELLTRLSRATARSGRSGGRRSERVTRAPITPGLSLTASELDESQTRILEKAAAQLRRLIRPGRD